MKNNTYMSILDSSICNINNLIHQKHQRDYELWFDKNQGKQYCEYKLYGWPNDKQLESYQLRKDYKAHLVYVHYLTPIQNSAFKQFSVFIEKIPLSLSNLTKLSFIQGLYLLKNVLFGFHLLFLKFGYVHIDEKLICLNDEGIVKVWINQNFTFNGIASTHSAPKWMSEQMKQKQMIATIFSLIQDKLEKNQLLLRLKKQKQLKLLVATFQNILNFIDEYINSNEIRLPTAVPELLESLKSQNINEYGVKNEKQFLQFKNASPLSKRKINKKVSNIFLLQNYKNGLKGSPKGGISNFNNRFQQNQDGIRARNYSQAGVSIASSRPRTTIPTHTSKPTKYFFCNKSISPKIQASQRQNNFLQSSQILNDFFFFDNIKNQVQVFNFVQNQKPNKNRKKRKYSANDKITINGFNNTQKIVNDKNMVSLARSMVIKNKLQDSIKLQNVIKEEKIIPISLTPSPEKNMNKLNSQKQMNPEENITPSYQSAKAFLNYKSVKKSIINGHIKQQKRDLTTPKLRSSFLKNMDMKNSQIITQRSSQYTSVHDTMKTITQSDIQTPGSDKSSDTFDNREKNASLFIGNNNKKGSDINISNSISDRKSGLLSNKDGGLINFTYPKRNRQLQQGLFKSILVQQAPS